MLPIIVSPTDTRQFKAVKLENGLRALLVHDPDSTKAGASLDVHIGSGLDPHESYGLAHFCEHMLFMGTEKYPDENSY